MMKENTERIRMCSMISFFFSKLYDIETFREKSIFFNIQAECGFKSRLQHSLYQNKTNITKTI